jgi:hypothetical protein
MKYIAEREDGKFLIISQSQKENAQNNGIIWVSRLAYNGNLPVGAILKEAPIKNFYDAKQAFNSGMSTHWILNNFAHNLLNGEKKHGKVVKIADVRRLARDLALLFDKWVW